jgi:hypothetical protein
MPYSQLKDFVMKMILQSISENAKGIKLSNESVFFKSIGSIPKEVKFQENLSYAIQVDGSMAHA